MSALDDYTAFAEAKNGQLRFVRRMNGSAQSILVKDKADQLWVLKPKSNLQGSNALGNEFLGCELCRSLQLPVPYHKIMRVEERFCNDPRVWLNTPSGGYPVTPGLHFASRYAPDLLRQEVLESIPSTLYSAVRNVADCLGIVIFDIWAMHGDSRQALFTFARNGLHATFFDNSHLFGGPNGLTSNYFIDGRFLQRLALISYQDRQLHEVIILRMQAVLPHAIKHALARVPADWFSCDIAQLTANLLERLKHLRPLIATAFTGIAARLREMDEAEQGEAPSLFRILTPERTLLKKVDESARSRRIGSNSTARCCGMQ